LPPSRPGATVEFFLAHGARLFGSVRDEQDQPVVGALVGVESSGEGGFLPAGLPNETDSRGGFQILDLDAGAYRLVARHRHLASAISATVTLAQDETQKMDLVLRPGVPVSGRLMDSERRPVRGSITPVESDGQSLPRMVRETSRAPAGADGRFSVAPLPVGRHVLDVVAPGFRARRVSVAIGTKPVDLGDIILEPGLRIQGTVVDGTGNPLADAELIAVLAPASRRVFEGSDERSTHSDSDGRFLIDGLAEGTYELTAQAYGFGNVVKSIAAGTKNVTLTLRTAGKIAGVVVDEAGTPVADYRITALVKRVEGDLRTRQRPVRESVTATDGRFELGIGAGTYMLDVSSLDYVAATVSDVVVRSGATTDVGSIVLRDGGTVRGAVEDGGGQPVAGATLTAFRGSSTSLFLEPARTTSDGRGEFELRGIAPGQVEIIASHPAYAEGRSGVINVDPAEVPAEVRIVLGQGARLEGSVRQRDGSPVPGVDVHLTLLGRDGQPRQGSSYFAETGADGGFALDRLPVGKGLLLLMSGTANVKTNSQTRTVDLREAQVTSVDFTFRDILVSGVLTRQHSPVGNATISFLSRSATATAVSTDGPAAPSAGPMRNEAVADVVGRYELLLDGPGRYTVTLSLPNSQSRQYRTVEIPDVESHQLDFDLGGVSVSGIVLDEATERPLPAALLSFQPMKGGTGLVSGNTGADGRFQVDLEPGSYRVQASVPEYAPGIVDVDVPTATDTRIPLSRGLSLRGRVVDEAVRGVGGVSVKAIAMLPDATQPFWANSLPDGTFELKGLKQQSYTLFAAGGASPQFAVAHGVQPGEKSFTLVLRPAAHLLVRVVGPDGNPIAGARVQMSQVDGAPLYYGTATESDAGGVVELVTPDGEVELQAFTERLFGKATIVVNAAATARVDVRLERPPESP